MDDSIRRVIMSKKVASRYVDRISEEGQTLTVYFSDGQMMRSFVDRIKSSSFGSDLSISEGFDRVTFLSTDKEAVNRVADLAHEKGLDSTDL